MRDPVHLVHIRNKPDAVTVVPVYGTKKWYQREPPLLSFEIFVRYGNIIEMLDPFHLDMPAQRHEYPTSEIAEAAFEGIGV